MATDIANEFETDAALATIDPVGSSPRDSHTPRQDLAQIIGAFNRVTENLSRSHEALEQQVVRLQRELASTDAQLQRSKRLAALGEMAAGIAHEIRNPLAAIQLYAAMLASDLDPGQSPSADPNNLAKTARKIDSAVRGLNAIVTDVLSFAREIEPKRRWIRVDKLFDQAIESSQPAIELAGIEVKRSLPPSDQDGQPLMAWIDTALVRQALLNLIRNAADAMVTMPSTPTNHTPDRVLLLSARRDESRTVLTVRDTGPGIAREEVDRIFNPFFTTRSTGTGLGLAIVHRIVDAHGGGISVYNDGGAVFEMNLPIPPHEPGRSDEKLVDGPGKPSQQTNHGVSHA